LRNIRQAAAAGSFMIAGVCPRCGLIENRPDTLHLMDTPA